MSPRWRSRFGRAATGCRRSRVSSRTSRSRPSRSIWPRTADALARFRVEIRDDVRDRDREALACGFDDPALEPLRAARRMRRDDQLVRAEGAKRVLDRLQRLRVADLAADVLDAGVAQPLHARLDALLRFRARRVLVRDPVPERRVQRRRHDEHLFAVTGGAIPAHRAESLPADGLVRDDEDPVLALGALTARNDLLRPRALAAEEDRPEHTCRQQDEDGNTEPRVDERRDDDQREVDEGANDELERGCLAAER